MNNNVPEEYWLISLQEMNFSTIQSAITHYLDFYEVTTLQRPESGLELINLQESVFNQQFFLGEVPISQCQVRITCKKTGSSTIGACKVMADNSNKAELYAITDGLLRIGEDMEHLHTLLEEGYKKWKQKQENRLKICAETRLDFSLL